jgi:hypothetical protein
VPASPSLPTALRIAVAIGYLEALAVAAYGASIALFERGGSTSGISGSGADLAPTVLVAVYVGFATLVLLVVLMLRRGRRSALTAFLLVQAFGLVVAQPLLQEGSTRAVGALVVVVALGAIAAILMKSARGALT